MDSHLMGRGPIARGLRVGAVLAVVAAAVMVGPPAPAAAAGSRTVRVSVAAGGGQANGASASNDISADGRYIAFISAASNLVPGDTNDDWDVFVRDRWAGTTRRVNLTYSGTQANDGAHSRVEISADGRYVAFLSYASNLVRGDTNDTSDVFVRDLRTGRTSRVSVSGTGAQGDGFSSFTLDLSPDGRYVLFDSDASNLVPGDTNGFPDVFVHDRRTRRTTRVSVSTNGQQGDHISQSPAVSADGRYVAFASYASTLVPGDTNGYGDVFLRDRRTGRTTLVSRTPSGGPGRFGSSTPTISADGRFVAFHSESPDLVPGDATELVDVFVRDRRTGRTTLVSVSNSGAQANDHCNVASISADGRYVVFSSRATNLVTGDSNAAEDVFLHDRRTRTISRVSVDSSDRQANDWSGEPAVNADGRTVAFASTASNLVPGDTNAAPDVFVRTRHRG